MAAYYNEIDKFAAAWLRELIKAGLIADGEVDERSIAEVTADDVRGFTQCHFFAGIGGWSYALRLASWPDDREVWTGSCPCQPFSSAGTQAGGHDPRDLWPIWFELVKECGPLVVFGEQVEAAIGHGWLDRLCDDLEAEDYAVGACGLPGPCVGAFDIRQRLWFVAESSRAECGPWQSECSGADRCGTHVEPSGPSDVSGELGHARESGLPNGESQELRGARRPVQGRAIIESGDAFWAAADWLPCSDGKARPVEPGTFPLAHGVPARVGRLRGYGNAIKPPLAAEFIKAYREVLGENLHGL